jgi:hypothetical protein
MNTPVSKLPRCSIYTRKSTEHNLELAFNSLDAQREACEAMPMRFPLMQLAAPPSEHADFNEMRRQELDRRSRVERGLVPDGACPQPPTPPPIRPPGPGPPQRPGPPFSWTVSAMRDEQLEISVSFDPRRGYFTVGSDPERHRAVVGRLAQAHRGHAATRGARHPAATRPCRASRARPAPPWWRGGLCEATAVILKPARPRFTSAGSAQADGRRAAPIASTRRAKRTDADRPTLSRRTSARHVGFRVSVDAPRSETY